MLKMELTKNVCIIGCVCLILTSCGSLAEPELTDITASGMGQSKPMEMQERKQEDNIWEGYAQEHADLVEKYPKWFDEMGKLVYPFNQTSEGWAEYDALKREKRCRIPKEIVDSLSTPQLLEAVADYPLIHVIGIASGESVRGGMSEYRNLRAGIDNVSENMLPALGELMQREDLIPAAYSYYKNAGFTKKYDGREDFFSEENVASRQEKYNILLAEYILCTKEAYDMLGQEERETVAEAVARIEQDRVEENERREKLEENYSEGIGFESFEFYFAVMAESASEAESPWKTMLEEHGVSRGLSSPEESKFPWEN